MRRLGVTIILAQNVGFRKRGLTIDLEKVDRPSRRGSKRLGNGNGDYEEIM